jgi:hypothetical protein
VFEYYSILFLCFFVFYFRSLSLSSWYLRRYYWKDQALERQKRDPEQRQDEMRERERLLQYADENISELSS